MRSSKGLIVALVISLGLNLALVGFIAGRASFSGRPPFGPDPSMGAFRVVGELPEARREALKPLMREHFKGIRPNLRQLRRAQEDIRIALAADPYAPDALPAALARFRQALLASQENSHRAFVHLAEALTPEERQLLLQIMEQRPRRHASHATMGPLGHGDNM